MQARVLFSLLLATVMCALSQQESCQDRGSQAVRMSVTSRRNQTGYQVTQLHMVHITDGDVRKEALPWYLDVERGTAECSGHKSQYLLASLSAPPEPVADYELYPLVGRYKLHTTPRTWEQALNTCQQEGAHLAVINSDTEAKVLTDMFKRQTTIPEANYNFIAYLGFNDIVTEGTYVTIFGEPLSSTGFVKWAPNEPNNVGGSATNPGQDCGALDKGTGLLDDVYCKHKLTFFCEQEL